jgi:nicotinamidase-related amidase
MTKKAIQITMLLVAIIFTSNIFSQSNSKKIEHFTPQNSAIVMIDHQKLIMDWVLSQDRKGVESNLRMLSRIGAELKVPLLITSTREDQVGTTWEGIQKYAPEQYARRIQRGANINCFVDPNFTLAVKNLNKKNLILCGLTTDMCLLQTVTTAVDLGYTVIVVADAGGSLTKLADETSFDYFRQIGVKVISTGAAITMLYQDFSTTDGKKAQQIIMDEISANMGNK